MAKKPFGIAPYLRFSRREWAELRADEPIRHSLATHGLDTMRRRHTCAHRVVDLLSIVAHVRGTAEEALSA